MRFNTATIPIPFIRIGNVSIKQCPNIILYAFAIRPFFNLQSEHLPL